MDALQFHLSKLENTFPKSTPLAEGSLVPPAELLKWVCTEYAVVTGTSSGDKSDDEVLSFMVEQGAIDTKEEAMDCFKGKLEPEDTVEVMRKAVKRLRAVVTLKHLFLSIRLPVTTAAQQLAAQKANVLETVDIAALHGEWYFPRTLSIRIMGIKDNAAMRAAGPRDAWVNVVNHTANTKTRLSVMHKMDDFVTIEVTSPSDVVTMDLDIEDEHVGTAVIPLTAEFVALRSSVSIQDVTIKGTSSTEDSVGGFVLQVHWQDDDHAMRTKGKMHYRVAEPKGVKLVRSPWVDALKTKDRMRCGELFEVSERLVDLAGVAWVKLADEKDLAGRSGWMPETEGGAVQVEQMLRRWTKATATICLQESWRRKCLAALMQQTGRAAQEHAASVKMAGLMRVMIAQRRFLKRVAAARKIHKWLQGRVMRKSVHQLFMGVRMAQAAIRGKLDRDYLLKVKQATTKIQKSYRGHDVRWHFKHFRGGLVKFQATLRGVRARYPNGLKGGGRGYFVRKQASIKIKNAYRTYLARSFFLFCQAAVTKIQNKLARPLYARKIFFDKLEAQIKPRVILLNQMQKQNKAKITVWRRLAKRCCPTAMGHSKKVVLIAGGLDTVGVDVARKIVMSEDAVWTHNVVVLADANAKEGKKMTKTLRFLGVGSATFKQVNLTLEHEVKNLISEIIEEHGQLDVLINNVNETAMAMSAAPATDEPSPAPAAPATEAAAAPSANMQEGMDAPAVDEAVPFLLRKQWEARDAPSQAVVAAPQGSAVVAGGGGAAPTKGPLHSPYACFQCSVPHLRRSKFGVVVNICPTETLEASNSPLHSKPGLLALTEFISKSFPELRCNAVAPVLAPYNPKRFELNAEVANMVRFLITNDAPYMTGQSFKVQGYSKADAPAPKPRDLSSRAKRASDKLMIDDRYTYSALYTTFNPTDLV